MFGRLLNWYIIYTFLGAVAPWQNFVALCKIHFTSKSCVRLYWQRYCTAVQQRASAKLYGVVQEVELGNFHTGRHLYSAGWPLRWASAHILVMAALCNRAGHYIFALWFLSFFLLLLSFFSSPNFTRRRLDVYHTSTHSMALVRI